MAFHNRDIPEGIIIDLCNSSDSDDSRHYNYTSTNNRVTAACPSHKRPIHSIRPAGISPLFISTSTNDNDIDDDDNKKEDEPIEIIEGRKHSKRVNTVTPNFGSMNHRMDSKPYKDNDTGDDGTSTRTSTEEEIASPPLSSVKKGKKSFCFHRIVDLDDSDSDSDCNENGSNFGNNGNVSMDQALKMASDMYPTIASTKRISPIRDITAGTNNSNKDEYENDIPARSTSTERQDAKMKAYNSCSKPDSTSGKIPNIDSTRYKIPLKYTLSDLDDSASSDNANDEYDARSSASNRIWKDAKEDEKEEKKEHCKNVKYEKKEECNHAIKKFNEKGHGRPRTSLCNESGSAIKKNLPKRPIFKFSVAKGSLKYTMSDLDDSASEDEHNVSGTRRKAAKKEKEKEKEKCSNVKRKKSREERRQRPPTSLRNANDNAIRRNIHKEPILSMARVSRKYTMSDLDDSTSDDEYNVSNRIWKAAKKKKEKRKGAVVKKEWKDAKRRIEKRRDEKRSRSSLPVTKDVDAIQSDDEHEVNLDVDADANHECNSAILEPSVRVVPQKYTLSDLDDSASDDEQNDDVRTRIRKDVKEKQEKFKGKGAKRKKQNGAREKEKRRNEKRSRSTLPVTKDVDDILSDDEHEMNMDVDANHECNSAILKPSVRVVPQKYTLSDLDDSDSDNEQNVTCEIRKCAEEKKTEVKDIKNQIKNKKEGDGKHLFSSISAANNVGDIQLDDCHEMNTDVDANTDTDVDQPNFKPAAISTKNEYKPRRRTYCKSAIAARRFTLSDFEETDSDNEKDNRNTATIRGKGVRKRERGNARSRSKFSNLSSMDVEVLPHPSLEVKQTELDKIDIRARQYVEKKRNNLHQYRHLGIDSNGNGDIDNDDDNGTEELPIDPLVCKFLICIMWDFDFRYVFISHQYRGVLAVAGVDVHALQRQLQCYEDSFNDLLDDDDVQDGGTAGKRSKMYALTEEGKDLRENICRKLKFMDTGGVLLADDMGLGKTVQGLGGAILRNCVMNLQRGCVGSGVPFRKVLPTVIVGPNDAVLKQWEETLLMGGIPDRSIKYYRKNDKTLRSGNTFILLTRYKLMTEMRDVMENKQRGGYQSNLFPTMPDNLRRKLRNQYKASCGKEKNLHKKYGESIPACVNRILRDAHRSPIFKTELFRTVLIDESHYLKNAVSYWGMGAAILGMLSERTVPLSGTPYNNGPQDMATQMMFIDPKHAAANVKWWFMATQGGTQEHIAASIGEWKDYYMVRRNKSILAIELPPKISENVQVSPYPLELSVYLFFEDCFMKVLKDFTQIAGNLNGNSDPAMVQAAKNMFMYLMARMTQMRASLIHPILPGGREVTILFSPSRRHLLPNCGSEIKNKCVCCVHFPTNKKDEKTVEKMDEEEVAAVLTEAGAIGDDDEMADDGFGRSGRGTKSQKGDDNKKRKTNLGQLVPLDSSICHAPDDCKHYIHEECLKQLLNNGEDEPRCPRCKDLEIRMKICEDHAGAFPCDTYCKHISFGSDLRGIKATAKIQAVVDWGKSVPSGDKAIIYSFFKGSLDILEGIFVEDLGVGCARFDGDVPAEPRAKELHRFKTSKSCRFLLASVQSGGVGLNIVEANHVAFLDRWFNPCVHAQAEDRCHRLKQTKQTFIKYFDANMTVDQVMASINIKKKNNATVLLADGTEIGSAQSNISYKELGGIIGSMMKSLTSGRRSFQESSPDIRLPYFDEEKFVAAVEEAARKKAERKRKSLSKINQSIKTSHGSARSSSISSNLDVTDLYLSG